MNKFFLLLTTCLLAVSLGNDVVAQQKRPRIGVAGIQIENSVFMPNRQAMVARPLPLPNYLGQDSIMGQSAIWLPALMGGAAAADRLRASRMRLSSITRSR